MREFFEKKRLGIPQVRCVDGAGGVISLPGDSYFASLELSDGDKPFQIIFDAEHPNCNFTYRIGKRGGLKISKKIGINDGKFFIKSLKPAPDENVNLFHAEISLEKPSEIVVLWL